MTADKIWVYNSDKKKFVHVKRDDPRLDWNYTNSSIRPSGNVRFSIRGQPTYCAWGVTKEAAATMENQWNVGKIHELERQIEVLKTRLVIP